MSHDIPPRFATQSVRRFVKFFEVVDANWPKTVLIDPKPLGVETFACRFRDAVRGVMEYNTLPACKHLVVKWHHDFTVGHVPGTTQLCIGAKDEVRARLRTVKAVGSVVSASIGELDVVSNASVAILEAIVTLLGYNLLDHAVIRDTPLKLIESTLHLSPRPIEVIEQDGVVTLL